MRISNLIIILLCAVSLFSSVLFFAFHNKWIEFGIASTAKCSPDLKQISTEKIDRQKVALYYWHDNQVKHEFTECLYSSKNKNSQIALCEQIINKWLQLLDEEDITHVRSTLQTCSILPNNQELLISFNRSFLPKEWSTYDKLMLIEALFKTIRSSCGSFKLLRFMVQHEAMHDDHLDFSRSWPIVSFTESQNPTCLNTQQRSELFKHTSQHPIIVLDPAGDAQYVGRILGDTFERTQTLQFAEMLKKELETLSVSRNVILTRVPGQIKDTFQAATLANTLNADLYISLNFYQPKEKQELPLYIVYALYDPAEEHIQNSFKQPKNLPYNYAYRAKMKLNGLSKELAERFHSNLSTNSYAAPFLAQKPIGLPFKSLIAVSQPAFACEIALSSPEQCQTLAKHFASALKDIFTKV